MKAAKVTSLLSFAARAVSPSYGLRLSRPATSLPAAFGMSRPANYLPAAFGTSRPATSLPAAFGMSGPRRFSAQRQILFLPLIQPQFLLGPLQQPPILPNPQGPIVPQAPIAPGSGLAPVVGSPSGSRSIGGASSSAGSNAGSSAVSSAGSSAGSTGSGLTGGREPILKGPRLPVLTQLSFYHSEDIDLAKWEDPVTFMQRVKVVDFVNNPLIDIYDCGPLMLQNVGRKLWRSLIKLVFLNRRRGYCIARSLVEDNLLVSSQYSTFRIKEAHFEDIQGKAAIEFMGYKQVKELFENLMKKVYGPDVISELSLDVGHLLTTLEKASEDELPACYHAALLSPAGRATLSIRIASGLRGDFVAVLGARCKTSVQKIYSLLGPIGMGLEGMHPFFAEWRQHSEEREKELERQRQHAQQQAQHAQQQQGRPAAGAALPAAASLAAAAAAAAASLAAGAALPAAAGRPEEKPELTVEDQEQIDLDQAGFWLTTINRHAVIHPFSKKLSALLPGIYYTFDDVVELLHYKSALYLPVSQALCYSNGLWDNLDMESCFAEEALS